MLHAGFWGGLKEYYEKEYNGILAGELAIRYAKEIDGSGASFRQSDRAFDQDEIKTWIEETEDSLTSTEIEIDFPNFYSYSKYSDEIASYFMWEYLDTFRDNVSKGNKDFVEEAIRLNWEDMIEEIPNVKDLFLF